MSFLRPGAAQFLRRWSEVGASVALGALGLWLMRLGGYFLSPLGASVVLVAAGWLLIALRRLRFAHTGHAPGVVETDEGQIGYLGPSFGGYVAIRELTEVRMLTLHGQRHWRLKQADGQALLVPHGAQGVELLYDAFAALPGIDMALVTSAPDSPVADLLVWRHPRRAALT